MSDIVTGTPAVVGFTNGYGNNSYNHGISGKDMQFATTVDRGEQTRDLLSATALVGVAVEKNGAANSLATEKIGAAGILASHDQAHLLALQVCDLKSVMLLEMQKCCCELGKEMADVKATVLSTDAGRIRDALQQTQTELLLLRRGNGNGNGNGNGGHD